MRKQENNSKLQQSSIKNFFQGAARLPERDSKRPKIPHNDADVVCTAKCATDITDKALRVLDVNASADVAADDRPVEAFRPGKASYGENLNVASPLEAREGSNPKGQHSTSDAPGAQEAIATDDSPSTSSESDADEVRAPINETSRT